MIQNANIHLPDLDPEDAPSGWPVVGLASCIKFVNGVPYHSLAAQYVPPITDTCKCLPVQIPAVSDDRLIETFLDRVAGIVLPGSTSNIEPWRYNARFDQDIGPHDPTRDATNFPLITKALERGLPILAICRGLQELNVALGGSLQPHIHEQKGRQDHRAIPSPDRDRMFDASHAVSLREKSPLKSLGFDARFDVNSLHEQAIDRLAPPLCAEAVADDGIIEMVSMPHARGFVLGVQWHPEYLHQDNPISMRIFSLFGYAVAEYAESNRSSRKR